jgi:GNAT superfamily N-acetyltransferase
MTDPPRNVNRRDGVGGAAGATGTPGGFRLLELHEARAHARADRVVRDHGDAILLLDPGDGDLAVNRMSGLRLPTDPRAFEARLADLMVEFALANRRPHAWVSPRLHEPAGLRDRLVDDGFVEVEGGDVLHLATRGLVADARTLPARARIHRLSRAEGGREAIIRGVTLVLLDAFGSGPAAASVIAHDLDLSGTGGWDVCLAVLEGEPVAAGRRFTAAVMTFLSSIATRPGWRRRGFAAAVVAALARDGRDAGGPLAHLRVGRYDAVPLRLYRALGFRAVGGPLVQLVLG